MLDVGFDVRNTAFASATVVEMSRQAGDDSDNII